LTSLTQFGIVDRGATINKTISTLVGKSTGEEDMEDVDAANIIQNENGHRSRRSNAGFDYKSILDLEQSDTLKVEKFLESYASLSAIRSQKYEARSAYTAEAMSTSDVRVSTRNRMMDLRKTTNHPYLIEYPLTEDGIFYLVDDNIVEKSGKMKVLDQLLMALLERGHKVLIFSQMTRMLDILGDYLSYKKFNFSRLDGSMSFEDRQANIDQFNETDETNLFLLSTRAGGLGINLTAADTCIIFDSDWNPQQDLQAQDRCHRIGQTRPVIVYRLVTAKTIDEKIVERAAAKRKLEKLVIHSKKFKSQDKKGLNDTLGAISPQELLKLLNSKDHADVFDKGKEAVFNSEDLEKLLDRSDLK
jgi:ATP-dependent DNA helicase